MRLNDKQIYYCIFAAFSANNDVLYKSAAEGGSIWMRVADAGRSGNVSLMDVSGAWSACSGVFLMSRPGERHNLPGVTSW